MEELRRIITEMQVRTMFLQLETLDRMLADLFPESYKQYAEEFNHKQAEDVMLNKLIEQHNTLVRQINCTNPELKLKEVLRNSTPFDLN